jgi:methionine aminopeptidase
LLVIFFVDWIGKNSQKTESQMNMYRMGYLIGISLLGLTTFAGAHLTAGSLVPAGGGTIHVGDVVSIQWTVNIFHAGKTDIGYSKDGGTTWTSLINTFQDAAGANTYSWTVKANQVSTMGKLRICQMAGVACTDANNVSAPSTGGPYVLVNQTFTVATVTGLVPAAKDSKALSMEFNPGSRAVEIGFALKETQSVVLEAFDTQGRLMATLLEGSYGAGSHQLSVFSNRLERLAGAGVFKLKVGEEVKTQTWNVPK